MPGGVQGLDRYAYANNNPVRYIDNSGHIPLDILLDIAFLIYDVEEIVREGPTQINMAALAADAACAVIPYGTGGGPLVRMGGEAALQGVLRLPIEVKLLQGAGKLLQFVDGNDDISPSNISKNTQKNNYTAGNFRNNLQELTGQKPSDVAGKQAHHVLPQKFERYFKKLGIDINDPKWGTWVDAKQHRQWSYEYNKKWAQFFKDYNYNPTVTQVEKFAQELAEEYGFETYYIPNAK